MRHSVEIIKQIKTRGLVKGIGVSFSKSVRNSAPASPQVNRIRLTEKLVTKGHWGSQNLGK